MTFAEKKEWEEIDGKIAAAEEKLAQIKKEMESSGSDFSLLQELMIEEEKWNNELEYLIERWAYLAERAEG